MGLDISATDALLQQLVKKFAATQLKVSKELRSRSNGDFIEIPTIPPNFALPSILTYMPEWERLHVQGLRPNTIESYKFEAHQECH